jgi:lipoprotein signal peptidase
VHLIYGSFLLIVFGLWTYSLYNRGSWWAILTGVVAVGGVGNLMLAFDRRSDRTSPSDQDSTPEQ